MLSIVLNGFVITTSLTLIRHLVARVQEHLSEKLGKSAINEDISSCKDCHSCSIINFYTLAQANVDFEAEVKEYLCIKNIRQN